MSNLIEYANSEFNRVNSDEYFDMINKAVIELLEVFDKQGHSGLSAGITRDNFTRLSNFKPLTPLTGEESEWGTSAGKDQNNRYFSVFRNEDGSAYNIDGKVFSDDGGRSWYTNGKSAVSITFPYVVPNEPERVILNTEKVKVNAFDVLKYWDEAAKIAHKSDDEYIAALTCTLLKDDYSEAHISKEYISSKYPENSRIRDVLSTLEMFGDKNVIIFEK